MNFFDRLANGWKITITSLNVLKENKQLVVFPILSGISLLLILGSFFTIMLAGAGWHISEVKGAERDTVGYFYLFLFYLINYFVVVFFNMALVHCTHLYFKGEEVSIEAGIRFSFSRIGTIFAWSMFAATVGMILRILSENLGTIGKIIMGLIGIVWSVATFFVVPVIAYENVGPIDAFKRSADMMRQKWGESIGAGFSFGLIAVISYAVAAAVLYLVGAIFHPIIGIFLAVLGVLFVAAILSAARTIFISAVYHNITGDPVQHFNEQLVDNLFVRK
ncbi:MAG: DUF6159 family protein [Flavisolibacter sp.]